MPNNIKATVPGVFSKITMNLKMHKNEDNNEETQQMTKIEPELIWMLKLADRH